MDLSYKEKSVWISLISTIAIFGYYFFNVINLSYLAPEIAKVSAAGLAIQAIIMIIIVETLFQSLLAIGNHKAAEMADDEREQLIGYKSNVWGYRILILGVMLVLGRIVILEFNPQYLSDYGSEGIPLFTAHLLLFSFILSEVVRFSSQIYYYRSGC
jgi:hypothetical protein